MTGGLLQSGDSVSATESVGTPRRFMPFVFSSYTCVKWYYVVAVSERLTALLLSRSIADYDLVSLVAEGLH